eukprot:scaffold23746_cov44-Phaeocystis_antarctica.AAC.2
MRCDPATPRRSQPRGFPAWLSWPPTMPAPIRLHPNPLVCPDRSNSHPSIDVSPHPRCHLCLPTRSCTCLATPPACAMPVHHAAHTRCTKSHAISVPPRSYHQCIASHSQPQLILTTSASPYTPSRMHRAPHAHIAAAATHLAEQPRPRASQCSENLRASQCSE